MTLKAEHEFSPNLNLHTIARAANYPRQAQITEPQICSNAPASVPVGGMCGGAADVGGESGAALSLYGGERSEHDGGEPEQIQTKSVEGDLWDQTEVTARFKVLGMPNSLGGGC